jgi:hypothetical protein
MEILLRDFLAEQLFGLDGLINLANFAFLLAFSVRDVLKLRIRTTFFSTKRFGRRSSGLSHS